MATIRGLTRRGAGRSWLTKRLSDCVQDPADRECNDMTGARQDNHVNVTEFPLTLATMLSYFCGTDRSCGDANSDMATKKV